jgi:hypothetical protein
MQPYLQKNLYFNKQIYCNVLQQLYSHTYTRKNAQVVTGLHTSCYKSVQQAVDKLCSHCLFLVVGTSLEQVIKNL